MKSHRLLYLCLERMLPHRAAATHVRGVIGGLEANGWLVTLIADDDEKTPHFKITSTLGRYLRLQLRAMRRLRSVDALYVRSHFAAWPSVAAARALGIPVYYEINGPDNDVIVSFPALRWIAPFIRALYHGQYRMASHLFCVTDGLAAWARSRAGHERVSIASNGYDADVFNTNPRPRPDDAPRRRYAIFYGDIARWHGLETLIAATQSPDWPEDVVQLIIGNQPPGLQPAEAHGRVIWMGPKPQRDLAAYIMNAIAGVAPIIDPDGRSSTGVMPLKLIEMMACGLPVIVSDLPHQADLVRRARCGLVVPPDDATALARAVSRIAADPADGAAMGQNGAAAAVSQFQWSAIAKVIDGVMRGDGGRPPSRAGGSAVRQG